MIGRYFVHGLCFVKVVNFRNGMIQTGIDNVMGTHYYMNQLLKISPFKKKEFALKESK